MLTVGTCCTLHPEIAVPQEGEGRGGVFFVWKQYDGRFTIRIQVGLTRRGAIVAPICMDTSSFATSWASVFLFLIFYEFLHPMVSYGIQILKYAHIVIFRVTIFKFLKMCTGIICTFKTELYFTLVKKGTVLF